MPAKFDKKLVIRIIQALLIAAPAGIAIAASLWPFEQSMLILSCVLLAACAICSIVFVRSLRGRLAGAAVLALVLSVAVFNWPLHAAYRISRPAMQQLASEVRAGKTVETPRQAGLFRIQKTELDRRGVVCLWTDLKSSGYTGFVQCGPENPPFNLWSHQVLDKSWQFISED